MATSSSTLATVNLLKDALSKELPSLDSSSQAAVVERCKDILQRLDECDMTLEILSETLIGTVVSKFKSNAALGSTAKKLIKKWKALAKQQVDQPASPSASSSAAAVAKKPPPFARQESAASVASASASHDEWNDLPTLRKNICNKLLSVLELSRVTLVKEEGLNDTAVEQLCISRTAEIEGAMQERLGSNRNAYADKARSLVFNLKKNAPLRQDILLGSMSAEELVKAKPEQLATADKKIARQEEINKLRDSRRLDWETANADKIDKMCGIEGDLKHASLFTCGRCKSTKTTSTQKQTRSADEPMTVFVLCMNCGKRWKFS